MAFATFATYSFRRHQCACVVLLVGGVYRGMLGPFESLWGWEMGWKVITWDVGVISGGSVSTCLSLCSVSLFFFPVLSLPSPMFLMLSWVCWFWHGRGGGVNTTHRRPGTLMIVAGQVGQYLLDPKASTLYIS